MSLERILVIESDEKIRDLLSRFLSGKGFDVLAVAEAADAAEQFDEYAPDLALVNAVVDGGSGSDVCIDLLDRRPQLHIIVMGTARQEKKFDRDARMSLGVEHFLMKPFSASKLIDMVDQIEAASFKEGPPEPDPLPARAPGLLMDDDDGEDDAGFDETSAAPLLAPPVRPQVTSSIPKHVAPPDMESILSASLSGSLDTAGVLSPPPKQSFEPRANTQMLIQEAELFPASKPTSVDALAGEAWDKASLDADAARHGLVQDRAEEGRYALTPMEAMGPTDPRGIYDEISLPHLLYNIFRDLFSGRVVLRRGTVRKEVFILNGRPINADSNIRSESLGYLLINEGVITEDQHRQSVTVMRDRGLRQGEALVELGMIHQSDLEDHLKRQVRERVLNCFGWTGAEYGLVYDPNVSDTVETFRLNPLVVIFDGIKTSFPVAPLVNHFDGYSRRPIRSTAKLGDYSTMLKPFKNELRVALLCDGQMTVGELLSASPYGLVDTLRILRALEIIKCIEFDTARATASVAASSSPAPRPRRRSRAAESRAPASGGAAIAPTQTDPGTTSEPRPGATRATPAATGRPTSTRSSVITPEPAAGHPAVDHATMQQIIGRHAMLDSANHYEMFQVATDATLKQITDNYNQLNVAFRHYVGTVCDTVLSGKARQVRERLVTAFDVLRDAEKRKTYDALTLPVPTDVKAPDLIGGELNYQRGRICLDASDFPKALAYLNHAVRQDVHQASYRMYRGYARFMTTDAEDRRARVEAHDEIKNALSENANDDAGYVLNGNCYKETGNNEQALKAYKKALSINRSNSAANREVARLEAGKTTEDAGSTGIFGKLFGR